MDLQRANRLKTSFAFENSRRSGPCWRTILAEEVYEAFAETDPARLRHELVQVAAVAAAWVEDIDSRSQPIDWAPESEAWEPEDAS